MNRNESNELKCQMNGNVKWIKMCVNSEQWFKLENAKFNRGFFNFIEKLDFENWRKVQKSNLKNLKLFLYQNLEKSEKFEKSVENLFTIKKILFSKCEYIVAICFKNYRKTSKKSFTWKTEIVFREKKNIVIAKNCCQWSFSNNCRNFLIKIII